MFKNLINFAYVRNTREAVGFYIAYLILTIVLAVAITMVLALVSDRTDDYQFGIRAGTLTAVIVVILLSFSILRSRKLMGNFIYIILALASGVLAFLGGGILGLIPVAYLSTKNK